LINRRKQDFNPDLPQTAEADLPVPDELKQAIPSEEQFLGQVLEILLLNYPEGVLFGLLGGVLTAYCVMAFA